MGQQKFDLIDWNQKQVDHIAKHNVKPQEVEEAVFEDRDNYIRRIERSRTFPEKYVYKVLGRTESGRYLAVILLDVGDNKAYCCSARTMEDSEQQLYQDHS